jgi:hypothetical protein
LIVSGQIRCHSLTSIQIGCKVFIDDFGELTWVEKVEIVMIMPDGRSVFSFKYGTEIIKTIQTLKRFTGFRGGGLFCCYNIITSYYIYIPETINIY